MEIEKNLVNRKKTVMILVGTLAVVSLLLVGVAFYLVSNPKTVMMQSLSKLTGNTKNILVDNSNTLVQELLKEDKVNFASDIKISMNNQELFEFNLSYLENKEDKKSAFDLALSQNNQSLVEANGILANDNLYFKIKDIMNYYYTEAEYFSVFQESNTEDYHKVLDFIYQSLKEELNENDIKKSKQNITLNEKSKKVTKLSYEVTKETLSNILDRILKDKEMIRIFSDVAGVEESEIKEDLNNAKEEIKKYENKLFYYNVYYYGFNNIVLYEIADDKTQLQLYQYDDVTEVVVIDNSQKLFNIKATEKDKGYDLKGKFGNYSFTGNYLSNGDDKFSLELDLVVEGMIISLDLDQTIKITDEYKTDSKLVIGIAGSEIQMDASTVYGTGEEIDTSVLSGAKNFEDMTEEELQLIMTNLQSHPLFSFLSPYLFGDDYLLEDDSLLEEDITVDLETTDSTLTY